MMRDVLETSTKNIQCTNEELRSSLRSSQLRVLREREELRYGVKVAVKGWRGK